MDGSDLRRWHRHARLGAVALGVAIAATALAACDSGGGGSTTASTVTPLTPVTTAPPTVQPLTGNVRLTGDVSISLPAATGECRLPTAGLPMVFAVRNPAFGTTGFIAAYGPTTIPGRVPIPPNVKVYVNGVGLLSPASGTGVTVAPDQRSVSFDVDVAGGTGKSVNGSPITTRILKGHITGELRCR